MVRGSPRHSESNGGVERVNRTVQAKLGAWMRDTGSRRWSIGCRIVMWRYNTQMHRTLGNVPYRLLFGQLPRVGISSLLLDPNLINSLATEAELNQVVDMPAMNEPPVLNDNVPDDDNINDENLDGAVDDSIPIMNHDELVDDPLPDNDPLADRDEGDNLLSQFTNPSLSASPTYATASSTSATASSTITPTKKPTTDDGSDSNDNLTMNDLKKRAVERMSNTFKTTGDENFTAWQVLRSELSTSAVVDSAYLQNMKLRDKVPVAYCLNDKNISKIQSFMPAILVRVGKKQWELMDENDDHMEQMEWDGDNGIGNMVGMYIKHPDQSFCDYFQSLTDMERRADAVNDAENEVTPRRRELRKRAHGSMAKAAASMKKRVLDRVGEDKICEVGEVVHVPLKDMDKTKVDTGNLTGVIVQVDKSRSQARVAVKTGLLKSWYVYHRLGRITGSGNDVELNGLSDTLANWKTMKVITEREAARNESMVGGQGKGDVTCNCKGTCNTNSCSCKKAGRICSSACHRNNFKCVNHDRGD